MIQELRSFSPSITIVDHPQKIIGMEMGTRSTIISLPSGRTAIISPIAFDDEMAEQIEAIGPVDTIIAPNLWHHLYFNEACQRWPDARALVAPGLAEKVELVDHAMELSSRGTLEDTLHWRAIEGAPAIGEHLFWETRDEVLIITDIAFHFIDHPQWWLRTLMRLQSGYGRLGPSRLLRSQIKDKSAFGASLAALLDEPWDSIIVAHGTPIEGGAKELFQEAFARYLPQV